MNRGVVESVVYATTGVGVVVAAWLEYGPGPGFAALGAGIVSAAAVWVVGDSERPADDVEWLEATLSEYDRLLDALEAAEPGSEAERAAFEDLRRFVS